MKLLYKDLFLFTIPERHLGHKLMMKMMIYWSCYRTPYSHSFSYFHCLSSHLTISKVTWAFCCNFKLNMPLNINLESVNSHPTRIYPNHQSYIHALQFGRQPPNLVVAILINFRQTVKLNFAGNYNRNQFVEISRSVSGINEKAISNLRRVWSNWESLSGFDIWTN